VAARSPALACRRARLFFSPFAFGSLPGSLLCKEGSLLTSVRHKDPGRFRWKLNELPAYRISISSCRQGFGQRQGGYLSPSFCSDDPSWHPRRPTFEAWSNQQVFFGCLGRGSCVCLHPLALGSVHGKRRRVTSGHRNPVHLIFVAVVGWVRYNVVDC
jgi:hypothetical protein